MNNKKVPMRTCVGCKTSKPKSQLIRMVNDHGKVLVDRLGKADGRGIYLCRDHECFEKAKKTKAINRSLKLDLNSDDMDQLQKDLNDRE